MRQITAAHALGATHIVFAPPKMRCKQAYEQAAENKPALTQQRFRAHDSVSNAPIHTAGKIRGAPWAR